MSDYRLDVEVSMANALQNLRRLEQSLNETTNAGNRVTNSLNGGNSAATNAARRFSSLAQNSSHAGEGMLRLEKNSGNLNGSLMVLTKSLLSYELAARAVSASDAYLGMQNRLKLVTESERELQVAMDDTFTISQKTGTVWTSTVQIYQRFLDVSDKVGKSQQEIGRITETVSKAVAMSGATADSANAAMVQFSQGIASGVLRGEEFNSVAEQTPALLDAIARGLNKDRSELRAMANTGKLTTEVILNALEKAEGSTDALFGRMTLGVAATFNKLRNATTQWVGEMNDASGATSVLVNGMNLLADNLGTAVFIAGTAALASLTKTIIVSTTATMADIAAKNTARLTTIGEIQSIVALTTATATATTAKVASIQASVAEAQANVANATSAKALAIAKGVLAVREAHLVAATGAQTAAIGAQTAATATLTAATSRLALVKQAALGLFGGGAGLIAMGVSAAAMYFLLSKNTDESAEAAQKHAQYMDLSTESINRFNSAQKADAVDKLSASLAVQNEQLSVMQNRYAAVVNDVAGNLSRMGNSQGLQEVYAMLQQVRLGTLSFEQATDRMNKMNLITPEQRSELLLAEKNYNEVHTRAVEAASGLKGFGQEAKVAGSAAQNAATGNDVLNSSLDETAKKAAQATMQMQQYKESVKGAIAESAYILERQKNTSLAQAQEEAKYYTKTGRAPDLDVIKSIQLQLKLKGQVSALEQKEKDSAKEMKKIAKDAESDRKKALKDAERDRDGRLREFNALTDSAISAENVIQASWTKFNDLWAEFGSADRQSVYDGVAAMFEEQLANASVELAEYKDRFSDYWATAADNVDDYYTKEQFLLKHSTKVNKEEKAKMTEELRKAWANEIDLIKIKWDIEKLEAGKAFMMEKTYLEELNRLRKEEINRAPDLTDSQKMIRRQIENNDYQSQVNRINDDAFGGYSDVMNSAKPPVAQDQLRIELDAQRQIIWEAQNQGVIDKQAYYDALEVLDQRYFQNSMQLWMGVWGDSLSGWSTFFKNVEGENSGAYKAIFAIQKGFTIASAALNIQKAISDGWAQGTNIYDKMAAVATIITQTGNIMSEISSIGFKDGGYTGNLGVNNIAGFVHGNEFVMPAQKTTKYRSTLEQMHKGTYESKEETTNKGDTYNLNTYITFNGEGNISATTEAQDASMMGDAMNAAMKAFLIDQISQGGILSQWANKKGF